MEIIKILLYSLISVFFILTKSGYGIDILDKQDNRASRHHALDTKQVDLIAAVKSGDLPTVKRLINLEKVSKNTQDILDDGNSLVHIAVKEKMQDVFSFLLKINCDTSIKNYYGETPLHEAASNNYQNMLNELLEEESTNVNIQDKDGNTALHKAIQKKNIDCVLSIINYSEKYFDYKIKNLKGMTILDLLNQQIQDNNDYSVKYKEIRDKILRFSNITVSTILQTEIKITDSIKEISSKIVNNNNSFFFSYSWDSEYSTKPMVDDFEAFIIKLGITNYYRDVRKEHGKGMTSGTHIEDFMKNARDSDVVIIFLNNAYLKSRNCMYEFLQVWDENSKKVSQKAFIIRHPEFVSVFGGPNAALSYTNYWNGVFKEMRSKDVSASDIQWHNKEEGFIGKICSNITPILQDLTSHIQIDYQQLRSKGFEDIFKLALITQAVDQKENSSISFESTLEKKKDSPYINKKIESRLENSLFASPDLCTVVKNGPSGGTGKLWEILCPEGHRITGIKVSSGMLVDSIELFAKDPKNDHEYSLGRHGGKGGIASLIYFNEGEYLRGIYGKSSGSLDSINFITNYRTYGPYGGNGGKEYRYEGENICGLWGHQGISIVVLYVIKSIGILTR